MSHPERRSGEAIIPAWVELHSAQVLQAISPPGQPPVSYRKLDRWVSSGLIEVESYRQHTHTLALGSGTFRIYRYPHILQASLIRTLSDLKQDTGRMIEEISFPPNGFSSWGNTLAAYSTRSESNIFSAILTDEGLDLITEPTELLGALATERSCVHINLAILKAETDEGIRRVLSTG